MSHELLPEFAHSLHSRFERAGIPLLLAGGWAVCHHGYSRFTNDIDWVCSRADEKPAIGLMESLGFSIVFEAMATRFKHPRHLDLPPVDLIWVSAETFARMGETKEKTGRRLDMPVVDLESLLAMKIHALKDHESRQGRDVLDLRFLLAENLAAIDDGKLREMCENYGPPGAYNLIKMNP